jgi:hypothetical protein
MQQGLDLNLASRPFKNNTLLWAAHAAAVLGLALFSVWNVRTYAEHSDRVREMALRQAELQRRFRELDQRARQAQLAIRSHDLRDLLIKANKANEVIDWKAFSWTRLFNRMEGIQPWNVKMLSVRPMFRTEHGEGGRLEAEGRADFIPVVVEGVAKSREALWELQARLFQDRFFDHVEPRSDELTETKEVLFTLKFDYYPEGKAEASEPPPGATEPATAAADDPGLAADAGTAPPVEPPAAEPEADAEPVLQADPDPAAAIADPAPAPDEPAATEPEPAQRHDPVAAPRGRRPRPGGRAPRRPEGDAAARVEPDGEAP